MKVAETVILAAVTLGLIPAGSFPCQTSAKFGHAADDHDILILIRFRKKCRIFIGWEGTNEVSRTRDVTETFRVGAHSRLQILAWIFGEGLRAFYATDATLTEENLPQANLLTLGG